MIKSIFKENWESHS